MGTGEGAFGAAPLCQAVGLAAGLGLLGGVALGAVTDLRYGFLTAALLAPLLCAIAIAIRAFERRPLGDLALAERALAQGVVPTDPAMRGRLAQRARTQRACAAGALGIAGLAVALELLSGTSSPLLGGVGAFLGIGVSTILRANRTLSRLAR